MQTQLNARKNINELVAQSFLKEENNIQMHAHTWRKKERRNQQLQTNEDNNM